ncbi:efflux RND transporter periplasmic adaptor subunit [Mesorhizobium sp.]|jgi:RND family efflux transporter MFP subunit|uniref:efflux RND transporter periplasmic adaptor subunit n=1 Tax=Mesorhizobium sp. TaxID=1871066 RepID=UPI000FE402AC|nr:efflux RND transporter periplasmic adaptor subunit [Mesorhizobium sp.]RWH71904.1 MAG: efflux RND transporter periplasmic adaptor subunit [Mesorhizobium sp.]RWL32911.1 MAG: efflux RND transporter periplasmic adaptor subunit [Mesorhizobium sp.]RWL33919.1 MAG: efflux RND transporter periplasmic adaptor subunit [Mesorhizobium sp.]RWL40012.1 MAG: efflux RND transporter periplasmic adaptor subunit [Mesorhizobium sp.]RWL48755.1 MAG: efflux RND transporter periplasmic adaptor subunit [Mesorhizobium
MNRSPRIASLLVLAALAACSRSEEKPPEVIRPVLSMVVEPKTIETFGFAGSVEPQYSADLAFRLLGRVVSRDVRVGDLVTKGTTIAALDPTALDLAVQASKADLSNAQAQFINAAASEDRQRQLLASANTSQATFDAAKQARQAAEAGVERANAALAKSQEQLGYARLFSDFDGVVTAVGAEVGQTVSPGQMIVTVARTVPREAVIDIPDQLTGDLTVGMPFEIVLQSLPTIKTQAKLREIAPQSEGATRTRRVKLTLIDPPTAFRLGSTITATRVAKVAPTIELPISALLEKDGSEKVWIVDPQSSSVSTREIKVASKNGGSFTVAGGLEAGMRVVTAGVHSLSEGQKVKAPEGGV